MKKLLGLALVCMTLSAQVLADGNNSDKCWQCRKVYCEAADKCFNLYRKSPDPALTNYHKCTAGIKTTYEKCIKKAGKCITPDDEHFCIPPVNKNPGKPQ